MVKKLTLSRDQLSTFLKDHEQIKQFEALFNSVDKLNNTVSPDVDVLWENEGINNTAAQLQQIYSELSTAIALLEIKSQQISDAMAALKNELVNLCSAENKAQLALDTLAGISNVVELLATAPPPREYKRSRYGSFYDTTTQVASAINTATAVTFNNTDLSKGVSLNGTATRITVDTDGVYNLQLSVQLDKTTGGVAEFFIWFRLNGVDVPNSCSQIRIQGNNAEIFSSLNYFFKLKSSDYVEVMYSVSDLSVQLLAVPATAPHPGIPSIIVTVSNNIEGML